MSIHINNIVGNIDKHVIFSTSAYELISLIDDDSADIQEITAIIIRDPSLSSSLLKLANSAWYMSQEPVASIETAIVRIGLNDVSKIALKISTQKSFENLPENLYALNDFFDHSLRSAIACQEIASHRNVPLPGTLYTAGLLHDIGQLILLNLYPQESSQALAINIDQYNGQQLQLCETEVFGFDHTQLGAELAKLWNFPPILQECIQQHHVPKENSSHPLEVACVHIANSVAMLSEFESTYIQDAPAIQPSCLELCQLDDAAIISIADTCLQSFKILKEKIAGIN